MKYRILEAISEFEDAVSLAIAVRELNPRDAVPVYAVHDCARAQSQWRLALRAALTQAFDAGYRAVDFTKKDAYLLRNS